MEYYLMKQEDFVPCEADEDDEINFPEISQKSRIYHLISFAANVELLRNKDLWVKYAIVKIANILRYIRYPLAVGGGYMFVLLVDEEVREVL